LNAIDGEQAVSQDVQEPESDTSTDVALPTAEPAVAPVDPLAEFGIAIPSTAPIATADRDLNIGGKVVFALDVARIDRAERFYHELFQLDIICRAWRQDDNSWKVTTDDINWGRELINGYFPELVVLQRPGWTLVLHCMGRGQVLKSPKIGDAEVPVSPGAMRKLRARILMKSYTVVADQPGLFAFRDPFAMVWTLIANESLTN
jgi:hypothetical protein